MQTIPCAPLLPPRRGWLPALAGAALFRLFAASAFAQEAAAAEPAPIVSQKTLFDQIMVAGPFFVGLLFLTSVFMVWLIIDGLLRTGRGKLAPKAEIETVRQHLTAGDYEAATAAVAESRSVFGAVAHAAFGKVGVGKETTEDAVFEQLDRERGTFNSRISYLSVIGVVTPMIGLTGTVFGMIHAFDTLGSSGVGDPAKLSAAIGEVLVCTGGGLVVAIPAFAVYYVLRNRISAGFRHVHTEINAIFHHLPYEQLQGIRLDSDAFIPAAPKARQARAAVGDTGTEAGVA